MSLFDRLVAPRFRSLAALSSLLSARVVGRVLGALTGVVLARALGPAGFGQLAGALAVVAFGAPLLQGAIDAATLRVLSRGQDGSGLFLRSVIGAKLWSGLLIVAAMTLVGGLLDMPWVVGLLAINALVVSLGAVIQTWWVSRDRPEPAALADIGRSLAWLAAAAAVYLAGADVTGAVLVRTIATILVVVAVFLIVRRRVDLRPRAAGAADVFRQSGVFLASGFFFLVYQQADRIMVLLLAGDVEAGRYAAAANLVAVFYMVPGIFSTVFLPRMYREGGDRQRQKRVLEIRLGSGLLLATLIVPLLVAFREELLAMLYGSEFGAASAVLLWLGGTVLLRFMSVSYGDLITAADQQRRRMVVQAGAAILNVILNLLFIPRWHAAGAAAATLVSESLLLTGYVLSARRLGLPTRPRLLLPGALACTGVTMVWLWQPWVGAAAMAAVAGYGVRRLAASS